VDPEGEFIPRLDILPLPQRRLWDEFAGIPPEFVLYGGTAIALHLGHRESVDFDFFGNRSFDPAKLMSAVPFMAGAQITRREPNTLEGTVDRDGIGFFDPLDGASLHEQPLAGMHRIERQRLGQQRTHLPLDAEQRRDELIQMRPQIDDAVHIALARFQSSHTISVPAQLILATAER